METIAATTLRQLSPAQRRIMANVERQRVGDPAVRVSRPTREVLLRLGLMERGATGHYTTELGDAVARLAVEQEES
jgi:hypothetical protein